MNFKIEKFIGGSLFNKPRNAKRRQLRSVLTSKFKFDGAPFRDKTDAENNNNNNKAVCVNNEVSSIGYFKMTYMRFLLVPS